MRLCMGCMKEVDDDVLVCPHCGFHKDTPVEEAYYLSPGTVIDQRYIVGRVLGYGGFGVTYLGWDNLLKRIIAIKEYFPSDYATRGLGSKQLTIYSGDAYEQFQIGLDSFISEAKRLAQLHHVEGVVRIYDCLKENDTGYIIMEYLKGRTIKEILGKDKKYSYVEAKEIILSVLDTLSEVHREGIIHRDIAPDNIFVTEEGEVKLLDFGAARYAASAKSRSLSVILKPGYAPEEQYRGHGEQGPWTDVYGVGATFYRMITGVIPEESIERMVDDQLVSPSKLGIEIPQKQEEALMKSLSVRKEGRFQTAEAFKKAMLDESTVKKTEELPKRSTKEVSRGKKWLAGAAAAAIIISAAGIFVATKGRHKDARLHAPRNAVGAETDTDNVVDTENITDTIVETDTDFIANAETYIDSEILRESETESFTEKETKNETEEFIDTEAEKGSETETETVSETESVTETEKETQSETELVTETEKETQSETKFVTETEKETQSETEFVTEIEKETQSETESVTETEKETQSETESVTETEKETQSETEFVTETEKETQSETELATETETNIIREYSMKIKIGGKNQSVKFSIAPEINAYHFEVYNLNEGKENIIFQMDADALLTKRVEVQENTLCNVRISDRSGEMVLDYINLDFTKMKNIQLQEKDGYTYIVYTPVDSKEKVDQEIYRTKVDVEETQRYILVSSLNVRKLPDTREDNRLTSYTMGEEITVCGSAKGVTSNGESDWYLIKTNDGYGYVSAGESYTTADKAQADAAVQAAQQAAQQEVQNAPAYNYYDSGWSGGSTGGSGSSGGGNSSDGFEWSDGGSGDWEWH